MKVIETYKNVIVKMFIDRLSEKITKTNRVIDYKSAEDQESIDAEYLTNSISLTLLKINQ